MAKKRKKAKGRNKVACISCGKALRQKWTVCPRCQHPLAASKAAAPGRTPNFVRKSAIGAVVPLARARTCWNGHPPGGRKDKCCTACGEPYGLSYSDHMIRVSKAAGGAPALAGPGMEALMRRYRAEENPDYREALWQRAHPDVFGNDGSAS